MAHQPTTETPTIVGSKEYTIYELWRMGAFPWLETYAQYRYLILHEAIDGNVLKTKKRPQGLRGDVYAIKGENLKKYLAKHAETKSR